MKKYIHITQQDFLNEASNIDSDIDEKIKHIILNANDIDDFIKALKLKYGDKVPLYHATTIENSKIIDEDGLKLTNGSNYVDLSNTPNLYFQIGHSDYISSNRSILYRWDAPTSIIEKYVYADMDGVNINDNILLELNIDIQELNTNILDIIKSFISNNMKLDGLEILFMNVDNDENFPIIFPTKIK